MKVKNIILMLILVAIVSIGVGIFIQRYSSHLQRNVGWQTAIENLYSFKYPTQFSTKYIHTVGWPPKITISDTKLVCIESGKEIQYGGITEKKIINDYEYCVTRVVEGAAGSMYTQYSYAKEMKGKTVVLTFTTRAVQCANYDGPQKSECEKERADFNIDEIADGILSSVVLK